VKRKEVNRARREWESIEQHLNKPAADWARQWAPVILHENKRLRDILRQRVPPKGLELEKDLRDALVEDILLLIDEVSDRPESVSVWWLTERLQKLIAPHAADHGGSDED